MIRKLDPQGFELAKQRALVQAKLAGGGQAVESVSLQGRPNGLRFRGTGLRGNGVPCRRVHRGWLAGEFGRQMSPLNLSRATKHEGPLDDVLQLPHVAGIIVGHEQRHDIRRDASDRLALPPVEPGDEVLHQQRNILLALAEGRTDARPSSASVTATAVSRRGFASGKISRASCRR